jgi:cold shock CspA family protein
MVRGSVKAWNEDLGCGVLTSPEAPDEVWAHHLHIKGQEGYWKLDVGADVEFEFRPSGEPEGQDGYSYSAVWVRQIDGGERDRANHDQPDACVEGGFEIRRNE